MKLRHDNPLVTVIRPEIAFRFGRRTNFGLFVEYGQIDKSNACGFDMPGAKSDDAVRFRPAQPVHECAT